MNITGTLPSDKLSIFFLKAEGAGTEPKANLVPRAIVEWDGSGGQIWFQPSLLPRRPDHSIGRQPVGPLRGEKSGNYLS